MAMSILDPGAQELASLRFASKAGAAQEAAALQALELLHTALDMDEASPGEASLVFVISATRRLPLCRPIS